MYKVNNRHCSLYSIKQNKIKRAVKFGLLTTALTTTALANANSMQDIERIEIRGQINNGLVTSAIDLSDTSSPDLRTQLTQLPGVAVNGNGLLSGIVQYRGLFGDRVNVKVDDISITGAGPNAMDSPLSHVLGSHQELVLHQGIAPVSVGYETLGGAIEIRDVKPTLSTTSQWQTQANLATSYFSNNDARMLGAQVTTAIEQSFVSVQGQYQDAENYQSGNGRHAPSTFYERSGFKFTAGHEGEKTAIDVLVGMRNTNESGTPALAMDIQFIDSLWYKLNLETELSQNWISQVKVFGNQNEHVMNNFQMRTPPPEAMQRLNTVDSQAIGMDINFIQTKALAASPSQKGFWSLGANYYQNEHNSRITNPNNAMFFIQNFTDIERSVLSAFAEYNFSTPLEKNKTINWQLGLRASEINMQAKEVGSNMVMMNPNVAMLVNSFNNADRKQDYHLVDVVLKAHVPISEHIKASLSIGQKERAPSYNEAYSWFPLGVSAGLADGRNYIGNIDLNKETAHKIDLGLQYQYGGVSVMGNVFYQEIDDYIIGTPSSSMPANMIAMMMGAQQPLQWDNSKARLYGADFYLSLKLDANWQLTTSAQWVDGKMTQAIEDVRYPLYRVAPLSANVSINWQHEAIDASLSWLLSSSQNDVSSLQNESPTAGHGVVNANLNYQINPELRVSVIAENIFDKQYALHVGGVNRVTNAAIGVGEKVPEIGRNVGVYLEYAF